jgi:hypothetical protein
VTAIDALVLNLEEIRRRSLKVWRSVPPDRTGWRPDPAAMTFLETVRHVLEGEFLYAAMLKAGRSVADDATPFSGRPWTSVEDEISFAAPFRKTFLDLVQSLGPEELDTLKVDRSDKGYIRPVGDFILRIAYHEAVHTGQLLSYLRMMNAARPNIWD